MLTGPDASALARVLSAAPADFPAGGLDAGLLNQLVGAGFLVPAGKDELAEVRYRFWRARDLTPAVLTVTTTMDCNLGCYYCYEERSKDRLVAQDINGIIDLARGCLRRRQKKALHVAWYGGEPLLNLDFLEAASRALQAACAREGVAYQASVISNGTCWPADIGDFIRRHRVCQVQITFDGLRAHHDRRRRYRPGRSPASGASAFDVTAELVGKLLDHARVDVRFNIDRGNRHDLLPFARFARSEGWFEKRCRAALRPARLAAYNEHLSFLKGGLSQAEFDQLVASVQAELGPAVLGEEAAGPPRPKTGVCAALAFDSVVVGADGRQYRCGVQVGGPRRAVGHTRQRGVLSLPVLEEHPDAGWWERFDPTQVPACSRCSFLPVCWGGCPKTHLEGDRRALVEQGAYWRAHLPRLIADGVKLELLGPTEFTAADQFRGGPAGSSQAESFGGEDCA